MKITKVRYGRILNIGNYENQRIELEAEVAEGDATTHVYGALKAEAERLLGIEGASASREEYKKAKRLVASYEKHGGAREEDWREPADD